MAVLFPGQGSQTSSMRDVADRWCPELVERAVERIGDDPFDHVPDGTRFAQPAIFCASVGGWRAMADAVDPVVVTGHSLGEIAALVAGRLIDAEDALDLVVERGRLMQEVGRTSAGGMAAMGGDDGQVEAVRDGLGLVVANYNSPNQVVLSGALADIEAAVERGREMGVRVTRLPVSGAFHSPLMEPMLPSFREAVDRVAVRDGGGPTVVSSVTGAPVRDVVSTLVDGLVRPVRWRQTTESLVAEGVTVFAETGPGTVLTRMLVKSYGDRVTTLAAARLAPAAVDSHA